MKPVVLLKQIIGAIGILLALLINPACSTQEEEVVTPPNPSDKVGPLVAGWNQGEIALLQSLWLGSLPELPQDPTNAVSDDDEAAALGHKLFFDTRLSRDGDIACATCHQPELFFTDGLAQAEAIGTTRRSTQPIAGTSYNPWFFWDGRRDSQWSQAMAPLEDPVEHGGTRGQFAQVLFEDEAYRAEYERIFGPLPNMSDKARFPEWAGPVDDPAASEAWATMAEEDQEAVTELYVNLAKAIAAYERQIMPGPARFDAYVAALVAEDEQAAQELLSADEVAGLRLFLTRGNCTQCHNGPLLTNGGFHSVGVPDVDPSKPDIGRFSGVLEAVESEFNCMGPYSDADPAQCQELRFVKTEGLELLGAFKVPSLRNVADTGPYMHSGQFETLAEVLAHYNAAPPGPTGHSDLLPLGFTSEELVQLEAFLKTLSGPLEAPQHFLAPP